MPHKAHFRTLSTRFVSTQKLANDQPTNQTGAGLVGGLLSLFFGIIVTIVALRFVFRLLDANAANGIVSWVYSASQPLVAPFFGIFNADANVLTGRFEMGTLVALVVYGLIASVVSRAFNGYHRPHAV